MDFLDASAGQALISKRPILKATRNRNATTEDEDAQGFKMDKNTGKLVITDGGSKEQKKNSISSKFMHLGVLCCTYYRFIFYMVIKLLPKKMAGCMAHIVVMKMNRYLAFRNYHK